MEGSAWLTFIGRRILVVKSSAPGCTIQERVCPVAGAVVPLGLPVV